LDKYDDISTENVTTSEYSLKIREDICEIGQYLYLASDELYLPLNRFVSIFNKNVVLNVNQYREKLKILKDNASEVNVRDIQILECMLHDHWSSIRKEIWATPNQEEAEEAMSLYNQLLGILEKDISSYKRQIDDLTI
ncbi:MAG: hypothetical protein ABFD07_13510, partial [Methanobacterium sp.]